MKAVLLSVHVLAAVILIGPITVAASLFPRYARSAATAPEPRTAPALAVAAAMHRISRSYTIPALAVPVFGIGLASAMHVLSQPWLIVSMALTALAAILLVLAINPVQAQTVQRLEEGAATPGTRTALRRLAMATGTFALLWAAVVILMIVRPGEEY